MRAFVLISTLLLSAVCAQHHVPQAVDPAYLRQYYQQIAQQASGGNPEATPIFEQNPDSHQQYISPGQQIRVKDNVQEQIRAQQQQTQAYIAPHLRQSYPQAQAQVQYVPQPTPQPQQILYRPAAPIQTPKPRRPTLPVQTQYQQYPQPAVNSILKKQQQDDEEEYEDPNASYQFGFDVKDDEYTNYQNRKETREGQVIKGSYSVVDSDGFIRTVKYTADPKEGFKAEVIREPTDIVVKIPTPPPQQLIRQSIKQQDYSPKLQHQPQQYQPQYQQY